MYVCTFSNYANVYYDKNHDKNFCLSELHLNIYTVIFTWYKEAYDFLILLTKFQIHAPQETRTTVLLP